MGDMEEKDQSNLHFLIGLCLTGILLALVWGMTLITVAGVIGEDARGTLQSAYVHCLDAAGDEFDQLKCAVGDIQKDQQLQSSRVDDLATSIEFNGTLIGTLMAFFGSLITVVVIFFAFRTRSEAIAEAKNEAVSVVNVELDKARDVTEELRKLTEEGKKEIASVKDQALEVIQQLEEKSPEDKTPLTEEQEDFVKIAIAKPAYERTATDWRAIAFQHVQDDEYIQAAEAFAQEASRRENNANIAMAWFNQALSYALAQQFSIAIESYTALIEWAKPYETENTDIRKQVAKALFSRATIFTHDLSEKQPEKAIEGYETLIKWGQKYEVHDAAVREEIAKARFNKAATFIDDFPEKQPENAIAGYDALIEWAKTYETKDKAVREHAAKARFNRAATFTDDFAEKQPENAIAGYDALIEWAKTYETKDKAVREQAAKARLNRLAAFVKHLSNEQPDKAIEGYETFIAWAKPYETNDNFIRIRLLGAYRNLGYTYLTDCDPPALEKSLNASENGIQLYLQQEWPEFPSSYPHLLEHKAEALYALGRKDEAIGIQKKLISEFKDHEDEDVQRAVSEAREKLAEWAEQE